MISIKVTTACGNSWSTEINCTFEQARDYFMGKIFNYSEERPMIVTQIDLLS